MHVNYYIYIPTENTRTVPYARMTFSLIYIMNVVEASYLSKN